MTEEEIGYDEDKAVEFIRNFIGSDISMRWSDDEILLVIDTIWDYYESKGMLEISADLTEEENTDLQDLVAYVKKEITKQGKELMDPADIDKIVKGELAYEETLEAFDN